MRKYPNKSKTFISDMDKAVYTWLYRHDNEWLDKNSPTKKVGNRKDQLIDWEERDQEVLILVKGAIDVLRNSEDKPERITITLVAKKINKVTLIQRHLDRLPNSKGFLLNNIESLEDFQMRRVKWAIKELAKEGQVKEWDVIIKVGLSKRFYEKLQKDIYGLIWSNNLM